MVLACGEGLLALSHHGVDGHLLAADSDHINVVFFFLKSC